MNFNKITKTIYVLTICTTLAGCLQPSTPQESSQKSGENTFQRTSNTITDMTINVGATLDLTIEATDSEQGQLNYRADNLPNWATLNKTTGALSGTPTASSTGTYTNIKLYVDDSDKTNLITYGPLTITVEAAPLTIKEDSLPPQLSNGLPNQPQSTGTVTTELRVITDEPASCRYSNTAGIAYNDMLSVFDNTGQTNHTTPVTSLSDGNSYTYYVRCNDKANNNNQTDYEINFSVLAPVAESAPLLSNGLPNQPQSAGTVTTDLRVITDKPASCRYSDTAGTAYDDMLSVFDNTGQTNHTTQVMSLHDGNSYTYFVRCNDAANNSNQTDYQINFSILSPVAEGTPWSYPAIPYTDWAYNPFTIELQKPSEWPSAPAADYYFVEPNNPLASDVATGDELSGEFGRFGYPERPRKSIPTNGWSSDIYRAGTVVWLKGGTYTSADFHSTWSPQFHGTQEQPIWFYGDPTDKPNLFGVEIKMYNSQHLIMDNIQWIGGNKHNSVLSLTRDRAGPTHHITLRNLRFENLNYIGGGGAIVGLVSSKSEGAAIHDIVVYKNTLKNNGGGFNWITKDGDHHGYKIDGAIDGNKAYRMWIIDNTALAGDSPDPIDGLYKSLSGNLVQVGDQNLKSGGVHHIYVAGNYQEFARQALGWTKRSHDVIISSNYCTDTHNLAGGNGQCYGHQYDASHNWWINNVGTRSSSGWMHTSNDAMDGPLFIVGNLFYGNRTSERNDNWRTCSGVSLYTQQGKHYIVNNMFDDNCHGVWAKTNRHDVTDELHIYNNIFTNHTGTIDATSKAISLEDTNGLKISIENNLFDSYSSDVTLNHDNIITLTELNNLPWASMNIEGDPLYIDRKASNYNILSGSATTDKGTRTYNSGAEDVYQQFINRYTNDPNYPGDPADYWPKDLSNKPRVTNDAIDIGPYEQN